MVLASSTPASVELADQISRIQFAAEGLQIRLDDHEAQLLEIANARAAIEDAKAERNAQRYALEEASGFLSLELEELNTLSMTYAPNSVQEGLHRSSIQERQARKKVIAKELLKEKAEDERLCKEEEVQIAQFDIVQKSIESSIKQLDGQLDTLQRSLNENHERLGQALYSEGADKIAEISEAITHAKRTQERYENELDLAKKDLRTALSDSNWSNLRQRAIATFDLDRRPADATVRIVRSLMEFLDVLEQDGLDCAVIIDNKPLVLALTPLEAKAMQGLIGPSSMAGIERRNWFSATRARLTELLEKHSHRYY